MTLLILSNLNLARTQAQGTGGIVLSGTAGLKRKIRTTGSGTVVLSGQARCVRKYKAQSPTGGVSVGNASNPSVCRHNWFIDLPVYFKTTGFFDVTSDFRWNTGRLPQFFFRVQGKCKQPDCDPLDNPEKCPQQYINTVIAQTPGEVCTKLRQSGWKWPIHRLSQFTIPLEEDIAKNLAQLGKLDPNCNQLKDLTFCDLPECAEFCLADDVVEYFHMDMSGTAHIKVHNPSGGIKLSGQAVCIRNGRRYTGTGGISVTVSYSMRFTRTRFFPDSNNPTSSIKVSGTLGYRKSHWRTSGSGGVVCAGVAGARSRYYRYGGTGGVVTAGEASAVKGKHWGYTGGGTAYVSGTHKFTLKKIRPSGSGGIRVAGSAKCAIREWHLLGRGGIVTGGEARVKSRSWHYTGSGSVILEKIKRWPGVTARLPSGGTVGEPSGGVVIAGSAACRHKRWRFISPGQVVVMGGTAPFRFTRLRFTTTGSGTVVLGGGGGIRSTWKGIFESSWGWRDEVEGLEAVFAESPAEEIDIAEPFIPNSCGCTDLPLVLELSHDLAGRGSPLRNFLKRNGLTMPSIIRLTFNRLNESYQGNVELSGVANDGVTRDNWNIIFEWQCTDIFGGYAIGNFLWKFSLYVLRRNATTKEDFDTRIMMAFPAKEICRQANNSGGLDFGFKFNTHLATAIARYNIPVDMRVYHDNLGMFKSAEWKSSPVLSVNISTAESLRAVPRQDIRPIFPKDPVIRR